MKRKMALLLTTCLAASLLFSTVAIADEDVGGGTSDDENIDNPVDEDSGSGNTGGSDNGGSGDGWSSGSDGGYDGGTSSEPSYITYTETVYDCDGSGNGYYIHHWSDGSETYENFYATSSSGSSGGNSESYYEESSYEETVSEETASEEQVQEQEQEQEQAKEEAAEEDADKIVWTMEQIAIFPEEVVSGIEDKEYTAGSAHKYDIHMGVKFDKDIVAGVLFNTSDINFDAPGEYDMKYFVYFEREALLDYMEENNIDESEFSGLDDETLDRVEVVVNGKVSIE